MSKAPLLNSDPRLSPRLELSPYLHQVLPCRGIFVADKPIYSRRGMNVVVLLADVRVYLPGGEELQLDHVWVGFAETIVSHRPRSGDVVSFSATVNKYESRTPISVGSRAMKVVLRYGLRYPEQVHLNARDDQTIETAEIAEAFSPEMDEEIEMSSTPVPAAASLPASATPQEEKKPEEKKDFEAAYDLAVGGVVSAVKELKRFGHMLGWERLSLLVETLRTDR